MTDNITKLKREMRLTRIKHQVQQRNLDAVIAQSKAERFPLIPVLSFYAYGYAGVATVQIFSNTARLSRWTDIGPMGRSGLWLAGSGRQRMRKPKTSDNQDNRSLSSQLDEAISQEEFHRDQLLFWRAKRLELEQQISVDDPFGDLIEELLKDDSN